VERRNRDERVFSFKLSLSDLRFHAVLRHACSKHTKSGCCNHWTWRMLLTTELELSAARVFIFTFGRSKRGRTPISPGSLRVFTHFWPLGACTGWGAVARKCVNSRISKPR